MNRDAGSARSPRVTAAAGKPPGSSAIRRSPVVFSAFPAATEVRDGWNLVLRYEDEDSSGGNSDGVGSQHGPWLVDLSHRRRWDFQDADMGARTPMDLPVPPQFGQVGVHGPLVINRMNRTQVAIWHLGDGSPRSKPRDSGFTETTDGHCMLAFVGAHVAKVLEHLTPLDLFDPARPTPFLTQGPVLRVPCQLVTFAADLVVVTCARSYGETFARAALESGNLAGLAPGGEEAFARRFAKISARFRSTPPPSPPGPPPPPADTPR